MGESRWRASSRRACAASAGEALHCAGDARRKRRHHPLPLNAVHNAFRGYANPFPHGVNRWNLKAAPSEIPETSTSTAPTTCW